MLYLREAKEYDFEFYYSLKCEPSSIYWSGFNTKPQKDNLRRFWDKYVCNHNDERDILLMVSDSVPIGYLQAVKENEAIGFSMGILENARGRGFGKEIISLGLSYYHSIDRFFAFVREDNNASMRSFINNGFVFNENEGYSHLFESENMRYKMIKLEYLR